MRYDAKNRANKIKENSSETRLKSRTQLNQAGANGYSVAEQTTEVMIQGWALAAAAEKQLLFTVSYGTSWSEPFTETKR